MKRASAYFVFSFLVCLLATASVVQAGGFALYEWGNRALGMGTANYATGADASVVAYNPALMTRLEGTNVYGGVTAVSPNSDVSINGDTSSTQNQVFGVPHGFVTHQISDDWTLGMGVFTRFGLGTKFDGDWPGATLLKEARLETFSFNPSVAYKVNDDLSIGGGIEIIKGDFLLRKKLPVPAGGGDLRVKVSDTALAFNLGLAYKPIDMVTVGLSYRSPVHFEGHGHESVTNNMGWTNSDKATMIADFPASYTVGLGITPTEKLTIEFDVIYTQWEQFDRIEFDFEPSFALGDNAEDFNYKSAWRFQLGAEYKLTDALAMRAGYVYDQTPIRHEYASPMLPANDRQMFTLGAGYKWDSWTVDVAGMYLISKERSGMSKSDGVDSYSMDFKNGRTWGLGSSIGYTF
ncbi:Outer membrane protein P1 precursor [Pseudodesulfovibrio hydrargyri]|uniref:Outer membrane protein P1 n=1 Tax=Pseudodesulfovibrio hydrargyri TaxID=2125990 RepID=A0A1J5N1H5_9BACT|nr:OmpP1/FadL family transporter [Pseudodesulfovibrio hydrargyri]OIQ51980.1 Outer membrane protein P1 precursor [Pseudodesulfovibrio hydrargyri]